MKFQSCLYALISLLSIAPLVSAQEALLPLRWGTDPTGGGPYIYEDSAGNYTGFEWDLAEYLAKKLGRKSVMRKGDWDKLPQLLGLPRDGDEGIDIVLNGYELRDDLAKMYGVTRPYYAYRLELIVNADDASIRSWDDLPGKTVGVLQSSVAHNYMNTHFGNRIDLQINPDVATLIGQVEKGQTAATIQDNPAVTYFIDRSKKLKRVVEARQPGLYVIYLRKNDEKLRQQINDAILEGLNDGTLRRIYKKYGIWNNDQKLLSYTQTGNWPMDETEEIDRAVDDKGNPWPRMIRELIRAAGMTVFLSVTSFPLAMLIGMLVAIGRLYAPRWVAIPLGWYVEFLRGTPLLLQLYFVFYLLPIPLKWLIDHNVWLPFSYLPPLAAGILGLAINYSAYESENYRAGLLAVPKGQMEAALSLGMSPITAIRVIVAPQAFRIVIPPVTNDFIALFKDTSVCSVILITELTRKYNELYNFNREYIVELAFVTAGLYLLMSYPMALLARRLESRTGIHGGRG